MENIGRIFSLLGIVFIFLGLLFNLLLKNPPKIPGDIYINKPGLKIYIPFVSAIVLSVVLTIMFNFFRK